MNVICNWCGSEDTIYHEGLDTEPNAVECLDCGTIEED